MAHPEVILPFTVSQYSSKSGVLFDLLLSPSAIEAVERLRNGRGVSLGVALQAEVRRGAEVQRGWAELTATFSVSDWVNALEQAGYGRTLLFEVPWPTDPVATSAIHETIETARQLLSAGHYAEVVAKCRMVLEELTLEMNQEEALRAARSTPGRERTSLQRELVMRLTAIEFTHLAHHPTGRDSNGNFDRNAAQMMLAITAALVSSAIAKRNASLRPV